MAQRQPDPDESFVDLAADAMAVDREFAATERSLEEIRRALHAELRWIADRGHLSEGDVAVIETYLEAGAFDSARQAFRTRVADL